MLHGDCANKVRNDLVLTDFVVLPVSAMFVMR